jgi:mono/diheme cytochrome c family protein
MSTPRILPMIAALASAALVVALAPSAVAAGNQLIDVGKFEYEGACAVCHGLTGKGGGPMAAKLTVRMPDLTVLAKNNSGVFPFDRVYQVIDGRQWVESHGSREMPIWGRAFRMQSSVYFDTRIPFDSESSARSRILALTEYVYRLQGK